MTRPTLLARRRASRTAGDDGRARLPADRATRAAPGRATALAEPAVGRHDEIASDSASDTVDASPWPRYLAMPATAPGEAAVDGTADAFGAAEATRAAPDPGPAPAEAAEAAEAVDAVDVEAAAPDTASDAPPGMADTAVDASPGELARSLPADPSAARASSRTPPPALQGTSAPAPIPSPAAAEPSATAAPLRTPSAASLTGREGPAQAVADEARQAQEAAVDDPRASGEAPGEGEAADAESAGEEGAGEEGAGEEGAGDAEAEAGTGAGGEAGGGSGAVLGVVDEAGGEAEAAFPEALLAVEEQPLLIPALERRPLEAPWQVPSDLPGDALPPPRDADGKAQAGPASAAQPGGSAAPAKPAPAPRPSEADAARKADLEAQALARRAYADLAQGARQAMDAFVDRANGAMSSMADRYQRSGEAMLSAWTSDRDGLRMSVERACMEVEGAAAFALLQLETASSNTAVAITQAGARADALITAGETAAAGQIEQVVTSLVAGHLGAYNGVIGQADRAGNAAILALNAFRDNRATRYSTAGAALTAAKNESLQARIPRWTDREAGDLGRRLDDKRRAWESSRDTSACAMSCGYRGSLTATHAQMVVEGRKSVTTALSGARTTLKRQTREGRKTLSDQRGSLLGQVRVQGRATESRLASQIRAALASAHQEARGALGSVHGAARGALAAYPRAVLGFDQALRKVAPRGASALRQSAERGPEGALQGLRRNGDTLDARLQGNRERLDSGLSAKARQQHQQRAEQLIAHEQAQTAQVGEGRIALEQSASGVVSAFQGLAGTVTQSAAQWAQPLDTRMAGVIAEKRTEAAAELAKLLTGGAPAAAGAAPAPAAADGAAAPAAASCSGCDSATGNAAAGGPAGAPAAAGAAAGPQGLTAQVNAECEHYAARAEPETFFAERITETRNQVIDNLFDRAGRIAGRFEGGFAGTVDEEGAIAVLRGLTRLKGHALDVEVYPGLGGGTLDSHLEHYLNDDPDDLAACRAYLRGDPVEGARLELKNSTGVFNDDEARIEATMRALSPDQLAALGREAPGVMSDVRDALGGTDLQVFDALAAGDHALADAHRMRDAIDTARRDRDNDAVHTAIERYTGAPGPEDWRSSDEAQQSADDRRTAVVAALGGIVAESVSEGDVAAAMDPNVDMAQLDASERAQATATARAIAYVTRGVDVYVNEPARYEDGRYAGGGRGGRMVSERMTGANRDLAAALLRHGEGSVDARASRIGVEMNRPGGPNPLNLDRATFDARFMAQHTEVSAEDRAAHRRAAEDRARVVMLAAQRYAGGEPAPEQFAPGADRPNDPNAPMSDTRVTEARDRLIGSLRTSFGNDTVGADLAAGLLTDARPSADTAALAMRHAMYARSGTNEELLFRFTERMNRDEVQDMRNAFQRQTGNSLDAELGVYGEGGTFTELSGDDRLRMERAMLGVPRNDSERLETAAFALQQQRRETGGFGASLAEGTLADRVMGNTERRLEMLAGGPIALSRRGELTASLPVFDRSGRYTGPDRDAFRGITSVAQTVAQNYSARIDAFADVLTTGIAILGAIAAAVITVATGGAAGPLIAAAIITGLASMSANYAIKGGRYGWEQAGIDLAMTAVQAITAGVGAQLGAAAQVASKGAQAASQATRTLAALSRIFTGNPIVDQIIVGAITGGIGGLGNAALNEQTWDSKDPVAGLFAGLLRGAAGGAATAALTNSVEALARNGAAIAGDAQQMAARGLIGRGMARVGSGLNTALNAGTGGGMLRSGGAMLMRGSARALLSGAGGMVGRGAELSTDAALGRYKGDIGDAVLEMGHAGLQAAIQGMGEGAGEAVGQGMHARRITAAERSINRERDALGLETLHGDSLRSAAEDLMFLNQHGRLGSDGFAQAVNLGHVATHGGMMPTVAERFPSPVVEEGMRDALLRHVPEAQRGALADVPIRVMPEAEFRAMTRSESGHAVTVIENGHPVVIVREGAPIAQLSNEGPHLLQAREHGTRDRVARLDEATLARWDSLDLDTQIDLYRTKIDLEIDAHERIAQSLAAEKPQGPDAVANHAADVERNEITLRNLRDRAEDVAAITPERRAAIDAGSESRPQYLDQPARLFSKERRRSTSEEIRAVFDETVEQTGRHLTGETDVDDATPAPPHAAPDHPEGRRGRLFDDTPEETTAIVDRRERGNTFNNDQEPRFPHNEVRLETPAGSKGQPRVDSYIPGEAIISRKHTQLADLGEAGAIAYINELVERYPRGAPIADVPSNAALIDAGHNRLDGQHMLLVPEQQHPVPRAVLEHAERAGVVIVDEDGRIYSTRHPDGEDGAPRATVADSGRHAEAMRDALMRHVPEQMRQQLGDTPVLVLPEARYRAQTESDTGPVVVLLLDGQPVVAIREGTPISRLADEGPHLMQAHAPATRAAVLDLGEETMRQWHTLDLDTQIALYRSKIGLEIEAHEHIARSLAAEPADTPEAVVRKAAELERNETTLRNLRARAGEVDALGPDARAAMRSDPSQRPQYLDQPARLFSKDPRQPVVFEPFVGPDLQSPAELQTRYPGARVIAGEITHAPDAAAIAAFQQGGGEFVSTRFGEALPDNHVDTMHVRFPLPHDKAQEMMMPSLAGMSPAEMMAAMRAMAEAPRNVESLTNLAPDALRTLAPDGRMEVVFDERSIAGEVRQIARTLTWTDPTTRRRYRFELDGEPRSAPRAQLAPHSGFNVPLRPEAYVVVLRKVEIVEPAGAGGGGAARPAGQGGSPEQTRTSHGSTGASTRRSGPGGDAALHPTLAHVVVDHAHPVVSAQHTADVDLRTSLLRHVPAEQRAQFADVEIRVLTDAEFHALTGSGSGHAVTVIENGTPVVIVREGTPLSHLADEGPHLMQAHDHATRARVLRLDEATLRQWDTLDLDTQIALYQTKIALEIDAHERIARSLAQETPDTPDARALHAAEVERNEATLRNLRSRHNEVADLTPERRAAIRAGDAERPPYLEQPARLFGKKNRASRDSGDADETTDAQTVFEARRAAIARQFSVKEKEVIKLLRRLEAHIDAGGNPADWISDTRIPRDVELRRLVAELAASKPVVDGDDGDAMTVRRTGEIDDSSEDGTDRLQREGTTEPLSEEDSDGAFSPERHENYVDDLPFGYKEVNFRKFADRLHEEFAAAGFDDVEAFMQGSAASGEKYNNGDPIRLDARRGVLPSDYDVAIVSPRLSELAERLGINIHKGPLTEQQIIDLGLWDAYTSLGRASKGGITVNFKVYRTVENVYDYGKTIPFPNQR